MSAPGMTGNSHPARAVLRSAASRPPPGPV